MKLTTLRPISLFFGIVGISLVRTFLENFSNPEPLAGFTSFVILHKYILFYSVVVISIGIIMGIIVKEPWMKHISRAVFFLPIVWVAPIVDLLLSNGACMSYIGTSNWGLVRDAVTFFGPLPKFCGITLGIRFEVILILLGTGIYLWKKTRNILKIILGVIAVYSVIFLHLALPGIVYTVTSVFSGQNTTITMFFESLIHGSLLGSIHHFGSQPGIERNVEGISLIISRFHFFVAILLIIATSLHDHYQKTIAWLANARPVRIAYYLIIATTGMVAALKTFSLSLPIHLLDINSYDILGIGIIAGWFLAVALNDLEDHSIDSISNPDRPLIAGKLDKSDMASIAGISGITMVSAGFLINWNVAMMLVMFQISYSLYSLEPFRMKRHFVFSSFLVGMAGLAIFLAGYFTVAPSMSFSDIPLALFWGVLGTLAIISNTKDFKDIPGDRAEGIKTLPVVFGARRAGKYLTWTLIIWILLWGIGTSNIWVTLQAIPWVVLDLIIKKRIPEYIRFLVVFVQIIILMVVL